MMIDSLIIIAVLSLGPMLHVMGRNLAGLPGAIVIRLPLMSKATPSRFAMYAFLIFAIVTATWLSEIKWPTPAKIGVAALIAISTLPNLSANYWARPLNTPAFFTYGTYRKYLTPGETVVTLPYWLLGNGMAWQAQTDMYFRMAGGWTGPPPPEFDGWPIVKAFATNTLVPDADTQLKAFLANQDVGAIIAGGETSPLFKPMLMSLDSAPIVIGGVTLYRIRPESLAPFRNLTAIEMETRSDSERLDTLITAANQYLAAGHDPSQLSLKAVEDLGLIPHGWARYPTVIAFNALWVDPWKQGGVTIGITGSYAALKPSIEKYRSYVDGIYFPFPTELHDGAKIPEGAHVFMISFDRAGLTRTAAMAKSRVPTEVGTEPRTR